MKVEQCATQDETEEERDDECRGGRGAWRKWRSKAEAWDPERWKAMAAAWASSLQDWTDEVRGERRTEAATKTCPYCAEEIKPAAIKCKHCATWLAPPPEAFAHIDDPAYDEWYGPSRRLTRSTGDAMAFGVLGGLGRFLGIDPTLLRVAYALGTFFTAIVPGILVYAMLALIIPRDLSAKAQGVE